MLIPGLVPMYEEREAAIHNHYSPTAWHDLDYRERAAAVAFHRLSRLVEMHQSDAVTQAMDRRSRQQRQQQG